MRRLSARARRHPGYLSNLLPDVRPYRSAHHRRVGPNLFSGRETRRNRRTRLSPPSPRPPAARKHRSTKITLDSCSLAGLEPRARTRRPRPAAHTPAGRQRGTTRPRLQRPCCPFSSRARSSSTPVRADARTDSAGQRLAAYRPATRAAQTPFTAFALQQGESTSTSSVVIEDPRAVAASADLNTGRPFLPEQVTPVSATSPSCRRPLRHPVKVSETRPASWCASPLPSPTKSGCAQDRAAIQDLTFTAQGAGAGRRQADRLRPDASPVRRRDPTSPSPQRQAARNGNDRVLPMAHHAGTLSPRALRHHPPRCRPALLPLTSRRWNQQRHAAPPNSPSRQ